MDLGLDERGNKLGELGTNSSALCDKLKKFQENAAEISEKEKGRISQKVDKNEKKTTDDSKVKEIEDSLGEIKESIKDNVQKLLDEEAETDALVVKADMLKSQIQFSRLYLLVKQMMDDKSDSIEDVHNVADETHKLQVQLDEIVEILDQNVNKLQQKSENLKCLEKKAESLLRKANAFHRTTRRLKLKLWLKERACCIVTLAVFISLFITAVVLYALTVSSLQHWSNR